MKNFRFESIWLLSRRDQRARKVNFATTNLIVGKNHTGKSSLIKTLFVTLGAKPAGDLARWDSNTISIVCFSIDGCRYYALHQNGLRALFAEDGKLAATAANYANWWPIIADLSGFNLVLPNKAGESAQADGSCFFLPFYVDQDGSWQVGWNTFPSIKQFKAPVLPTLEYFTGVKPPEWYALNAKKNETQVALSELKTEARILSSIRNRFANSMPTFGPKIDPRIFEQDIALLTAEMTALNAAQEKVRDAEVREREALSSARLQVDLAAATLQTYDQDSRFLRSTTPRPLVCPTCGAEHDKSFLSVLGYAEDARILRELVVRLRNDSEKAAAAYQKTHRELVELDSRYQRISDILSRRRGELRFDDVVKSMGAERAFGAFEEELAALNEQIDKKSGEIDRLLARQNELTDARRTKTIVGEFREKYATATIALNLPPIDTKKLGLAGRPNVSGSGGPRSILAYYSALWTVALSDSGSISVPLVIDAPQQQGQDEENLPRIIKYIATALPAGAQILLGTERHTDERFETVIELDEPYQLLQAGEYESVAAFATPFVDAMYEALVQGGDEGENSVIAPT